MSAPGWLTERPIAHRGLHDQAAGIVENSLSAARAAIEAGFAIECDVQLSADGEAMVFHDFTLERLTGATGRLDEIAQRSPHFWVAASLETTVGVYPKSVRGKHKQRQPDPLGEWMSHTPGPTSF